MTDPATPDEPATPSDAEIEAELRAAVERAVAADREQASALADGIYPPPLMPGATAYRDGAIWSADYRKRLPDGASGKPTDPEAFADHRDPDYLAALELMARLRAPA